MAHVTFIHGICNKPAPDRLLTIWHKSLAKDGGINLDNEGITSSMVYWADVMYESPDTEAGVHESNDVDIVESKEGPAVDLSWREGLAGDEKEFVANLTERLRIEVAAPDDETPPESEMGPELERVPLPWWLKKRVMRALLRDVHHYLFNTTHSPRPGDVFQVQDKIRQRFVAAVKVGAAKPAPHVVVSHSMGTVIAYDCLKRVGDCPRVDALMTIGSPLGLDEVQDKLRPGWSRDDGFPHEKLPNAPASWVNVFDRLDPVAGFDPKISNDYRLSSRPAIKDLNEQNSGKWRHNISKYLGGDELRGELRRLLGF